VKRKELSYDLLVIGCGAAGFYAARQAGRCGLKTAVVEKSKLGGTAFYWGSLAVKRISDRIKTYQKAVKNIRGIRFEGWPENFLLQKKDFEDIENKIEKDLKTAGVDIYFADGEFISAKKYQLKDKIIKAENIIIATGSQAKGSSNLKIDGKYIISHQQAVTQKKMPQKMMIVGSNIEGAEFASIYSFLGVKVILVEMEADFLPGIDNDLSDQLKERLKSEGVEILTSTKVESAELLQKSEKKELNINLSGDFMPAARAKIGELTADVDQMLLTAGRKVNYPAGIEKTGIKTLKNAIAVDQNLQTNIAGIYAAGDVNGSYGIASTAINDSLRIIQAIKNKETMESAADSIPQEPCSKKLKSASEQQIPLNIFTIPEIAGIGMSEEDLKSRGIEYRIERYHFKDCWRSLNAESGGFAKVILAENENKVLGIYLVGDDLSEIISSLSVNSGNLSWENLAGNIYVHPSRSEILAETALKFNNF